MKKFLWLLLFPALLLPSCIKESPEPIYVPEKVAREDRELIRTTEIEGIYYALYTDNTCEIVEADPALYNNAVLNLPSYCNDCTVIAIADEVFPEASFTHVTLPLYLETIGKRAFQRSQLEKLTLPDTLVSLGEEAFGGCIRLERITFGKGLKEIPVGAFYGCRSLKEVLLPEGVTAIGEEAFGDLTALEKVQLPSTLTAIDGYAFWHSGTDSLSFTIPESVKKIGTAAFGDTAWLKGQTAEFFTVGSGVLLRYNGSAESVTLPDEIQYVSNAFDGTGVRTLILPEGCELAEGALEESGVEALFQNGQSLEVKS